jgi:D-alanyl-D-alanine dipeptidase
MRGEFYVSVPKDRLFSDGYIAAHSGHSRASTIDLTIVPAGSAIPRAGTPLKLKDCTAPQAARFPDNSLDFGTGYDCFSVASHPSFQDLSAQARANRLLLRTLMMQAGLRRWSRSGGISRSRASRIRIRISIFRCATCRRERGHRYNVARIEKNPA